MRRKKTHRHETRKRTATGGTKHGSRVRQRGRTRREQKTRAHDVLTICVYKMSQQQLLLLLLFVSRLRVRICGFVLPSFQVCFASNFCLKFCALLPQKIREKRL